MQLSNDLQVDANTPPCFLWHTADDPVVPIQNSLLMASALAEKKIPFEMHVFPHGPHGLSLCDERTSVGNPLLINPAVAQWLPLSLTWLRSF